jgi:hypothetical protein
MTASPSTWDQLKYVAKTDPNFKRAFWIALFASLIFAMIFSLLVHP